MQQQNNPISLFPMLNILVAVLGVFIYLMIAIVVLSIGVGKEIVFVPSNDGELVQRKPVYVEWTGTTLILHPTGEQVEITTNLGPLNWTQAAEVIKQAVADSKLAEVFEEIKAEDSDRYAIIVVRPSGFTHFRELKGFFELNKIPIGYEPIDAEWNFAG